MHTLILASSSIYRRQMLSKITDDYQWVIPEFTEDHTLSEDPVRLAIELAKGKARSVADQFPVRPGQSTTIIGCDQVCFLPAEPAMGTESTDPPRFLHKPGDLSQAVESLMACSGKRVCYQCGVHILHNPVSQFDTPDGNPQLTTQEISFSDAYWLQFREFSEAEAVRYCELDEPYDCAGAIKTESYGIRLIASHHGSDPYTLQGLPLIKLREQLISLGIALGNL